MGIRILLVTGSYIPDQCGVGDYTRQLAIALAAEPSVDVAVLTTGAARVPVVEDRVMVARIMPDWSLRHAGRLRRAIADLRPDVVHVQYPTQGYGTGGLPWLVPALARVTGARVVQTWHEGFNRRDLARFLPMALTPGRTVVVRKEYLRQFLPPFGLLARLRRPAYISSAATLPRAEPAVTAQVRERYRVGERRLLVFFGFLHPLKQVEQVFAIADPTTDHILIVGNAGDQAAYLARIEALATGEPWAGHAEVAGFVEPADAAAILAAADAVVLPLKVGGGEWNTSILAGILQQTFVLTTSTLATGYDAETNVYYANIDDLADMRYALATYSGRKRLAADGEGVFGWAAVAARHLSLYRSLSPADYRAAI